MTVEKFLSTKKNVKELSDRWIFDCNCKNGARKNRQKGVLYKNNLAFEYCSHNPTQGIPTGIDEGSQYEAFQRRKENYYLSHGIDFQKLLDENIIDEQLNPIVAPGKTKKLVDSSKGKLRFSAKGIFKRDVGSIYPVLGSSTNTLHLFSGEADYYKGYQDGLTCTTKIFGEGTNLTDQDIAKLSKFEEIILVPDVDQAGVKARDKTLDMLNTELPDKKIGYVELPFKDSEYGKDYCDWRQSHSIKDFLSLRISTSLERNQETSNLQDDLLELPKKKEDILLPIDQIHPIFKKYWEQFEGETETCKEYVLTSKLVSIAATLGNKSTLKIDRGIKANMYGLLLGDSTFQRKTTGMDYGTEALSIISEEKREEYEVELESWEQELELYNNLNNKEKAGKEKPQKPVDLSNIYSAELTPEMLLEKMAAKPDGLFLYSEAGSLLARFANSYMTGFKEKLTDFFDGRAKPYRRETKTGGCFTIKNAAPSLLACSTFQWLQAHLNASDLLSGFLARFVVVCKRNYPDIDIAWPKYFKLDKDWIDLFRKLDKFDYDLTPTKEAKESYENWYKKFKAWAVKEDKFLHSFLGRLMTVCHKIAMINHALDYVLAGRDHTKKRPDKIEAMSYEQAYGWIKFFALNICDCYGELTQGPDLQELKILEIIKTKGKNGKISHRNLARAAHIKTKDLHECLNGLAEKNYVQKISEGKYTFWKIAQK